MKTYNFLVISAEGETQNIDVNAETKEAALNIMQKEYLDKGYSFILM